jgi:hypothetical protein
LQECVTLTCLQPHWKITLKRTPGLRAALAEDHEVLGDFMRRFADFYSGPNILATERLIAAAAAHLRKPSPPSAKSPNPTPEPNPAAPG